MSSKNTLFYLALICSLGACGSSSTLPTDAAVDNAAPDQHISKPSQDAQLEGAIDQSPPDATPTQGTRCAVPIPLTLSSGKVTITGDISQSDNEFANSITCFNKILGIYSSPQLYYKISLEADKLYRVYLNPDQMDQALYAFPATTSCTADAINSACAAHYQDALDMGFLGGEEEILIRSDKTQDWIIVVDAPPNLYVTSGTFTLQVEEYVLPTGSTYDTAQEIQLKPGEKKTIEGNTMGVDNQTPTPSCPLSSGKPAEMVGPQMIYKVSLKENTPYRIEAKTGNFTGYLYIFSSPGTVSEDCSSQGKTGKGDTTSLLAYTLTTIIFTPASSGTYYIAVDSIRSFLYGRFTLSISEKAMPMPTFTAPFGKFDFESECKDLASTGDWECGQVSFSPGGTCTPAQQLKPYPPNTVNNPSQGMWGTVLNSCFSPATNYRDVVPADPKTGKAAQCDNLNPDDDSILAFKVTIPSSCAHPKLKFLSWEDLTGPNDWYEIRVDDQVVAKRCEDLEGGYQPPTEWVSKSIDLDAFKDKTVTVSFHFMASALAQRAGWYLDDLEATCD